MKAPEENLDPKEMPPDHLLPKVSPVGVLQYAENDTGTVQERSRGFRLGAWVLLVFFALATISTGILSVGAYCLTSDGADTRQLRDSPWLDP